jgi:acyl carrier protein
MTPLATITRELSALRPLGLRCEVRPETTLRELGLDPIDRITLALAIEDETGRTVTDNAMQSWDTVADLVAAIEMDVAR